MYQFTRQFTRWSTRLAGGIASPLVLRLIALAAACLVGPSLAQPAPLLRAQQPAQTGVAQQAVGAIKNINGNTIVLKPDTGADVTVLVSDATRIVRVAPGQTDLKNAEPIHLPDLQVGDRILVRGKLSDDSKSITASGVIVMKRSDVDAKQERDRQDWQKRGIGGIVTSVEPGAKTITISVAAPGASKNVIVQVAKDTVLRRYAPDSVQFDDAKPSALDQIRPGDQLRARGARNVDGSEFAAEEIVSGVFRNIAGLLTAVDAAANTVTLNDLLTKKPIVVKISPQSQVVKLPPQVAQGIAARLKGAPQGVAGATASSGGASTPAASQNPAQAGAGAAGRQGGAQADLQQMLSRMPKAALADFQKGDAVMIVSTEGTASGGVTAITLVGGVESILAASPAGGQSMTLAPWNVGGGDAGEANP
jgi:co-chaperonin GroES (HSP10)